jgi:hypothetical protein
MATFTPFDSFIEAAMEGKHDFSSDTLKIALTTDANAPDSSADSVLADLTTVSLTNLSSDTVAISSSSQTSGTYTLALTDKTLTASGGDVGPFQHIVVYNDSAASDELIGTIDVGSTTTITDGNTFDVDFATSTITIAPA